MRRNKKLMILCGILLCVSLAAFGVSRYEKQKEIIKNSDEIIMEISDETVNVLSWECDTGAFGFHRDENGNWIYDEDEEFPVDEEKIKGLLELFEQFGVSFVIEEVEDFGQYGLDTPVCTIHMETEGEDYEILLGNYSAMDSERYVSVGDGNVYLVKTDPLDRFTVEISDLIRHDQIPEFEEVTQMRFSGRESEQIVYEEESTATYNPEDVYFVKREEGLLPLDTSRVQAYLDTISSLNPEDYVNYKATEEDLAAYGLDTPELSIMIDYKRTEEDTDEEVEETFVLHVGRDPAEQEAEEKEAEHGKGEDTDGSDGAAGESGGVAVESGGAAGGSGEVAVRSGGAAGKSGGVAVERGGAVGESGEAVGGSGEDAEEVTAYARVGESKIIYRLTTEQYKKLKEMTYDSLRHQELFWADFSDVNQLDIQLEDTGYTITSEQDGEDRVWYYQDEELDITELQDAIRGLRAGSFTDQAPDQKEEIGLTIYLDNEAFPKVHIQLYRYDGEDCIAVVDGEPEAFVARSRAVDLIEAVNSIVLK